MGGRIHDPPARASGGLEIGERLVHLALLEAGPAVEVAGLEQHRVEAREGGRIFERWLDGSTADWGTMLSVARPHRLVFTWHPRSR
jgi:hypothetical protein